jgi:acid phosphatase (class A)
MARTISAAVGMIVFVSALVVACVAAAADPQLKFLKDDDINAALLLPPPPADGTDRANAELDELHRVAKTTTPDRWAQANYDFLHEDGTMFQVAIAPGFDLSRLPATAKLLSDVRGDEAIFAAHAKNYFKRNRPWIADPHLKTCSRQEAAQSSYPSGHATMAFAMGVVLAKAMPELATQILARAEDYSEERLVCGMHYRSDIEGGQTLGTAVAVLLLRDPDFEADLAAARQELTAAHLTGMAN